MTRTQDSADAGRHAAAISQWDDEGGAAGHSHGPAPQPDTEWLSSKPLIEAPGSQVSPRLLQLAVDEDPHNSDGLLLHGWDQDQRVTAFIGRKVMDEWAAAERRPGRRKSLFRDEYNALGRHNLKAIERIVRMKYGRGPALNPQYPFVDILLSDIAESGELLDM